MRVDNVRGLFLNLWEPKENKNGIPTYGGCFLLPKKGNEKVIAELEKAVMLKVVDSKWMEHLDAMDMLREGIGLRAYGQKNPLVEYKFEAYDMFEAMIESIQEDTIMYLYRIRIELQQDVNEEETPVDHLANAQTHHDDVLEPQDVD